MLNFLTDTDLMTAEQWLAVCIVVFVLLAVLVMIHRLLAVMRMTRKKTYRPNLRPLRRLRQSATGDAENKDNR